MFVLLSAKILVVGGYDSGHSLEIIDLINTKLKSDILIDKNGSREGSGTIFQNQPLILG